MINHYENIQHKLQALQVQIGVSVVHISTNKRQVVSTLITTVLILIITLTIAPIAALAVAPHISAGNFKSGV